MTHDNKSYPVTDDTQDAALDWLESKIACKRCARLVPHRWRGLCARCYLHAGGSQ